MAFFDAVYTTPNLSTIYTQVFGAVEYLMAFLMAVAATSLGKRKARSRMNGLSIRRSVSFSRL